MSDRAGPNAEREALWNEVAPALWREHGDRVDVMDGPPGEAMLRAARLRTGDRVLDVGCGAGATTVEAARQVGPAGTVVGVDISPPMLKFAADRVNAAGLTNVELLAADAQVHRFGDGAFDAIVSRFGTMFFADPAAAFANLARSMRPGGRLAIVVPRAPHDDPWVAAALAAAAPHLGAAGADALNEFGTYVFADGVRLDRVLAEAGFRAVHREALTLPIRLGADADDVVGYLLAQPEVQALMAGAPADQTSGAVEALRAAFAPYAGPDGVVMDTSCWLGTASR
ncbi:MAG TPA: methyltransferase domain-containing protein [Jiangellaceae bacterium]